VKPVIRWWKPLPSHCAFSGDGSCRSDHIYAEFLSSCRAMTWGQGIHGAGEIIRTWKRIDGKGNADLDYNGSCLEPQPTTRCIHEKGRDRYDIDLREGRKWPGKRYYTALPCANKLYTHTQALDVAMVTMRIVYLNVTEPWLNLAQIYILIYAAHGNWARVERKKAIYNKRVQCSGKIKHITKDLFIMDEFLNIKGGSLCFL
jgi:hypothetical protein